MDKPYCRNCYHDPHGSTSMDACNWRGIASKWDKTAPTACGCRIYIKWSREDSQREENQLVDECESRLAKEYGIENHPKRARLWSMAWEHGHSSGFSEVENYYREFVELMV